MKVVYVLRANLLPDFHKIGFASSVEQRAACVGAYTPGGVTIVAVLEHAHVKYVESWAHEALKDRRVNGEWFRCSEDEACDAVESAAEKVSAGKMPPTTKEKYLAARKVADARRRADPEYQKKQRQWERTSYARKKNGHVRPYRRT